MVQNWSWLLLLTACAELDGGLSSLSGGEGVMDADGDGVLSDSDCNDQDPQVSSGWELFSDQDGDGYGTGTQPLVSCEIQDHTAFQGGDCDDADSAVHPGAAEICDDRDNDCDGAVDDDDESVEGGLTWYLDADGDGHGDSDVSVVSCAAPGGFVEGSEDCDDGASSVANVCPDVIGRYLGSIDIEMEDWAGGIPQDCEGELQVDVLDTEPISVEGTGLCGNVLEQWLPDIEQSISLTGDCDTALQCSGALELDGETASWSGELINAAVLEGRVLFELGASDYIDGDFSLTRTD